MARSLPPLLARGSRVRVVSPSGPVTPENLAAGLATLKDWGLEVELDESVYARAEPGYLAGKDELRVAAINSALAADVDAVFFSRGGYGLTRIVHDIEFEHLSNAPKWVVGFSDVTAFHLAAATHAPPVATLHGHVVKSFASQSDDLPRLHRLLFEGAAEPVGLRQVAGPAQEVSGPLLGGNAALVAAMLGNDLLPDFEGHVLFLEDIGEVDYRLDRLLTSIARSRHARGTAAVVLGDFTDCSGVYVDEAGFPAFVDRLANELAEHLDCPVFTGLPAGHGGRNVPLPVGLRATISDEHLHLETSK